MTALPVRAPPSLEFRLLGPLEAWRDGEPLHLGGERQRGLLALLLLRANRLVTTEQLVDDLFAHETSEAATNALWVALSRLRRLLDDGDGESVLVTRPGGYLLRTEPGQLDVAAFERLFEEGQGLLAAGDPETAAAILREALALFRGPPLADLSLLDFVQSEIRRLEELHLAALMERLEADLALGRDGDLIPELEALIGDHPFQERLRGQLMLALYRSGRQADALEVYRATRDLLRDDLGLEPSRALQQLERGILQQDASLEAPPRRRPARAAVDEAAVCPFKGLAPFDAADAAYFCGRERLVAELVTRLAATTLVGLVGPSGNGKSSLLRAGVLPALAGGVLPGSERWQQLVVRPGADPLGELANALAGDDLQTTLARLAPGERLVLACDQLEELFTVCTDEVARAAFLDALATAAADPARRALVLVALRADFYGRCAAFPRFAELLSRSHVLVGPMERDELVRAIELPATRAGLELERPLVDALVADVLDEPGALPLLSATLLELWGTRDGQVLRHAAYRASGGVRGAVARLAEHAYGRLDKADAEVARGILLRLASGSGETLTRRRVPLEQFVGARVRLVVGALTESRLLTTSDGSVEVAHEALLHEWPRLRRWLDEDAQARRLHEHLIQAARAWDEAERETSELYRGARLASILEWASEHTLELSGLEREFVDASRAASELEAGRQRNANRRLRGLLVGAGVLLGLALLGGALALLARAHANREATAAVAQGLGAQALAAKQLDLSLLLARQGVAMHDSLATEGNLEAALERSPAAIKVFRPLVGGNAQSMDVSPDGRYIAVFDRTANPPRLAFVETATGRIRRLPEPVGSAGLGFFASDGKLVLGALDGSGFQRIDPKTTASGHASWPFEAVFSPSEQRFALARTLDYAAYSGRDASEASVWDLRRPTHAYARLHTERGLEIADLEIGSGLLFAFESPSRTVSGLVHVEVWSLKPWRRLGEVVLPRAVSHDSVPWAVDRSGLRAAFGQADGSVVVADLRTGAAGELNGRHEASVTGVGFSPDGRTIVSTGDDNRVLVWDAATGNLREALTGHANAVYSPAFSPDARTLYTLGLDGLLIAWDLTGSRRLGRAFTAGSGNRNRISGGATYTLPDVALGTALDGDLARFALSPRGTRIATAEASGGDSVVDLATGKRLFETNSAGRVDDVAWSPDGRLLATAATSYATGELLVNLQTWNAADGSPSRTYAGGDSQDSDLIAIAFSPDGRLLAAASVSGSIYFWDVRSGKLVGRIAAHGPVADIAFSRDSNDLAAAIFDSGLVKVWRLAGRKLRYSVKANDSSGSATAVAFSPDGRLLATGGGTGRVKLWDAQTGKPRGSIATSFGAVESVAFDRTSRLMVTAGADGTTGLWVVASRLAFGAPFSGLDNGVTQAAFTGSGQNVVTVDANGRGFDYDLRASARMLRTCTVAGRTLTREEWSQYLPGRAYKPACAGGSS